MMQRSAWVDIARGAAIVLVVFGHVWRGLYEKELIVTGLFRLVDNAIYAFHMPLFFMISGFFFFSQLTRSTLPAQTMHATRRLLIPLVLWTYIFLLLRLLFSNFTNAKPELLSLFVLPIPGIAHLWFLWALWVIQIGFFLLAAMCLTRVKERYFLYLALVLTIGLNWMAPLLPFSEMLGAGYTHAVFFVAGAFLYRTIGATRIGWAPALGAGLVFIGLISLTQAPARVPILEASLALGLSVCFLVFVKGLTEIMPSGLILLRWAGVLSFSIYMMHTIFSAGAREILLLCCAPSFELLLTVCIVVGLALPIGVSMLAAPYKLGRILGLQQVDPKRLKS